MTRRFLLYLLGALFAVVPRAVRPRQVKYFCIKGLPFHPQPIRPKAFLLQPDGAYWLDGDRVRKYSEAIPIFRSKPMLNYLTDRDDQYLEYHREGGHERLDSYRAIPTGRIDEGPEPDSR